MLSKEELIDEVNNDITISKHMQAALERLSNASGATTDRKRWMLKAMAKRAARRPMMKMDRAISAARSHTERSAKVQRARAGSLTHQPPSRVAGRFLRTRGNSRGEAFDSND